MVEHSITFTNQNAQLVGMLHLPEGEGRYPGVILCHGFTGNKAESHRLFVRTARMLAKAGFGVLRFDFRGSGDSEGDFVDMTVAGEISDAIAAWRWMTEQTGVEPERLALLGFSLGGCVAAYAAADIQPAALVLWSAVGEPEKVFTQKASHQTLLAEVRNEGYLSMSGWRVGRPFVEELPTLDPLVKISQYMGPALFVHGSGDQSVFFENSHLFYQNAGGTHKELHIIEEADHAYTRQEWEDALVVKTVTWLQKYVK